MNTRFRVKLRNKIFVLIAVVSIVPLVIAGTLSVWSIETAHRLDVANMEDSLLNQKTEEIRRFIADSLDVIRIKTTLEEGNIFPFSSQQFFLKNFLTALPGLEEAAFLNLEGKETLRLRKSSAAELIELREEKLRDESGTEKFSVLKEIRDYVSPVYFTLNGPMVTIAAPLLNKKDRAVAFISGELNLEELQKRIKESHLGATGYLYLVNEEGVVIAGNFLKEEQLLNLSKSGIVSELLGGKDFLGTNGQRRYKSFWGEEVVAAGQFLPEFNWGIVAEWPTKEADAVLNTLLQRNLAVILLVFLAVILVSIFLANIIVKPIKTLEAGTQLVRQGKFDQPVNIRTGDELEELGIAFNKMIEGLKQLQQLKDEFVFIAAHELRTPVAAIKGYLSLVLEGIAGPVSDAVKEFIHKVMNANARLIRLVDDLLEVARSEAGRLTVEVRPTDISLPIQAVLTELKPLAEEKSIEFGYSPALGLPKVLADENRVKEIMVNLVGNAIKYTVGAGTVTISHEVWDNTLITHIKDTGIGMSKEEQKKLFEKFYRIQNEKTRDVPGTGLGLFIVKQIVEKMNGKIWAESEEGKGSTFSFSLPVAGT
jgi:signal transduction histidine kinase